MKNMFNREKKEKIARLTTRRLEQISHLKPTLKQQLTPFDVYACVCANGFLSIFVDIISMLISRICI